jgi:enhancer of polycomb-like protein
MTLLQDPDHVPLMTDPSIVVISADGRHQSVTPFKLGPQTFIRRDAQGRPYPLALQPHTPQPGVSVPPTPISVPTQVKKMPPAVTLPQLRISANGGLRPPGLVTGSPPNAPGIQPSPTNTLTPTMNGVNGIHRSGSAVPQRDLLKTDSNPTIPVLNAVGRNQADLHPPLESNVGRPISPVRPKSQNQHPIAIPNGYHLTAMNGYPAMPNGTQYLHAAAQHNGLSVQQMQNLKSTFGVIPPGADLTAVQTNGGRQISAPYMGHVVTNGANFNLPLPPANMNLKLPPARQMQWSASPIQRGNNGVDSSTMNGSPSPSHVHTLPIPPVRSPSANGSRAGMRGIPSATSHSLAQGAVGHLVSHSMSPLLQHSPSPMPTSQGQPSPRQMSMVSPLLQHQQPVGSSQSGY